MRKWTYISLCIVLVISLGGCNKGVNKYQSEFTGVFDTVCYVTGYAESTRDFTAFSNAVYERLTELNNLFDIYHTYENVNNLKTVNDNAGIGPVTVPWEIIDLLAVSVDAYKSSEGSVNIAMGAVLKIWHNYRSAGINNPDNAKLPPMEDLLAAAAHVDIENIIIDATNSTVFLKDPEMSIDPGAIAKGFAVELCAADMKQLGYDSFIISLGGNIRTSGRPMDKDAWSIGVQDPFLAIDGAQNIFDTLFLGTMSVVSSGDYQRYYTVDGTHYNHIIDPQTLMPARSFKQVTVICPDSTTADILSTALFILPQEQGEALANRFEADALWIYEDGNVKTTAGYGSISKNFE